MFHSKSNLIKITFQNSKSFEQKSGKESERNDNDFCNSEILQSLLT